MRHGVPATRNVFPLPFILFTSILTGWAEPTPIATVEFSNYIAAVEARLARQHDSTDGFLVNVGSGSQINARLRRGELAIEQLTPGKEAELPGALLHHWRGTAFVPGATADDFERLLKDLSDYPQIYSPQVVRAAILSPISGAVPDHFTAIMRVRQKHVITIVMDTSYDISYRHLDARHGYSISRSLNISEIEDADTRQERSLGSTEDHGFLWRLNTYWSYEERDGGLYIQIESISLTRDVPAGLGWAVRPYVESVPRESLEFTLHATCNALRTRPARRPLWEQHL